MASRAGALRGLEDDVAAQIAFLRPRPADVHGLVAGGDMRGVGIGIGIHRHGANPQPPRGARDPAGDFAAIRDQQFGEHRQLLLRHPGGRALLEEGARCLRGLRAKRAHRRCIWRSRPAARRPCGASTTSASSRLVAASAAGLADSSTCAWRSTSRSSAAFSVTSCTSPSACACDAVNFSAVSM